MKKSVLQQALGDDWQRLPTSLKAHYIGVQNQDEGYLTIIYPKIFTPVFYLLYMIGALLHRQGTKLFTTVTKRVDRKGVQHWERSVQLENRKIITFNSRWIYFGDGQLIEFVNPFIGLKMSVSLKGNSLHYEGDSIVLNFFGKHVFISEKIFPGHTTIVEKPLNDQVFYMDFKMTHPWFGCWYQYSGQFKTICINP